MINLREMPMQMHGSRRQMVATFAHTKRISLDVLCDEIASACTLTKADIVGCITALTAAIAKHVAHGHTVAVGELGTFSASLKVDVVPAAVSDKDLHLDKTLHLDTALHSDNTSDLAMPSKTAETAVAKAVQVKQIGVRRVCFRASNYLREQAEAHLQRQVLTKPRHVVPRQAVTSTPEERLSLLRRYLEHCPTLSTRAYAELTSQSRYRAEKELQAWLARADVGVAVSGRGTHRVWVWKAAGAG